VRQQSKGDKRQVPVSQVAPTLTVRPFVGRSFHSVSHVQFNVITLPAQVVTSPWLQPPIPFHAVALELVSRQPDCFEINHQRALLGGMLRARRACAIEFGTQSRGVRFMW
jgi:hypothetical protein